MATEVHADRAHRHAHIVGAEQGIRTFLLGIERSEVEHPERPARRYRPGRE